MAQCTPNSFDLTGKVALITGASYGIGMAIAKAMAANGATIVFTDIKQELKNTSVSITCYDKDGKIIKQVTSSDPGNVDGEGGGGGLDENPLG